MWGTRRLACPLRAELRLWTQSRPIQRLRKLTGRERSRESNRRLACFFAFIAGATDAGGYLAVKAAYLPDAAGVGRHHRLPLGASEGFAEGVEVLHHPVDAPFSS